MSDPQRENPLARSDWLSNIWSFLHSLEERIVNLEKRVDNLQSSEHFTRSGIRINPHSQRSLDED